MYAGEEIYRVAICNKSSHYSTRSESSHHFLSAGYGLCWVPVSFVCCCSFPDRLFIALILFFCHYLIQNALKIDNNCVLAIIQWEATSRFHGKKSNSTTDREPKYQRLWAVPFWGRMTVYHAGVSILRVHIYLTRS